MLGIRFRWVDASRKVNDFDEGQADAMLLIDIMANATTPSSLDQSSEIIDCDIVQAFLSKTKECIELNCSLSKIANSVSKAPFTSGSSKKGSYRHNYKRFYFAIALRDYSELAMAYPEFFLSYTLSPPPIPCKIDCVKMQ